MEQTDTTDQTEKRTKWNAYMTARYNKNKEKSANEQQAYRYKKKFNISEEESVKWGEHLADIIKLKQILLKLPANMVYCDFCPKTEQNA
jgi:hypothetical protein